MLHCFLFLKLKSFHIILVLYTVFICIYLLVISHKTTPYAVNSRNLEAGKIKYPHVICKGHSFSKDNFDLWCKVVHCHCVINPPSLFNLQSNKILKLLRLITAFLREFVMCAKNVAVISFF